MTNYSTSESARVAKEFGSSVSRSSRRVASAFVAGVLLILSRVVLTSAQTAQEHTLIVPLANANAPGGGAQAPFFGESGRYLSIYDPGEFLAAMPNGAVINSIAFRLDESIPDIARTIDIQAEIRMSTSPSLATSVPSFRWSENIGKDETVVFPKGSIHWQLSPAGPGAKPFDLAIQLQQPFFYNPREGSLAVDILSYNGINGQIVVDAGNPEDFGRTAISLSGSQGGDLAATLLDSPVLMLRFTAVPEPVPLLLGVVGLAAFLVRGGLR